LRHLDVGDDQVRPQGPAALDQLAPVLGDGDHVVAQPGQALAEVVPDVGLVVGDHDAQGLLHGVSRGRVIRISAPPPAPGPTAMCPPCASTMRFAIAMPRPVPFVLVVKNGSKMRCRCSGPRPGPLSRTATRTAGPPPASASEQRTSMRTGSGQAAREFSKT